MKYSENADVFVGFYAAQRAIGQEIGLRPWAVRNWLATVRVPTRSCEPANEVSSGWRMARLSSRRHREIRALLDAAERSGAGAALGEWLVRCLPVSLLVEIAAQGQAAVLEDLSRQLLEVREEIFLANYGLARTAAGQGRPEDFGDRLSAACCGLLDAIDRYVPGEGAARFAFFATYWIRYHVTRHLQKSGSLIFYPIHRQRQDRRAGLDRPDRPEAISIEAVAEEGPAGERSTDCFLCDDAPPAYSGMDATEVSSRLTRWLRTSVPPGTRVILAATHSLMPLPEAACDYVTHLRETARERLRFAPGCRFPTAGQSERREL